MGCFRLPNFFRRICGYGVIPIVPTDPVYRQLEASCPMPISKIYRISYNPSFEKRLLQGEWTGLRFHGTGDCGCVQRHGLDEGEVSVVQALEVEQVELTPDRPPCVVADVSMVGITVVQPGLPSALPSVGSTDSPAVAASVTADMVVSEEEDGARATEPRVVPQDRTSDAPVVPVADAPVKAMVQRHHGKPIPVRKWCNSRNCAVKGILKYGHLKAKSPKGHFFSPDFNTAVDYAKRKSNSLPFMAVFVCDVRCKGNHDQPIQSVHNDEDILPRYMLIVMQ